ncbi:MAG: PASTA domain-containing protein, partial [Acidobacteria bacterium]|nr:PASTA domain-containing protein [Acidobacteriota bacterium]
PAASAAPAGSTAARAPLTMPNLRGEGMKAVIQRCGKLGLRVRLSGSGVVTGQSPVAGMPVKPGQECRVELSAR